MYELAKYVWDNYPHLKETFPLWKILSIIDRNPDKVIYIKDDNGFRGAAFYLRLTDESLSKILNNEIDIGSPQDMTSLLSETGDNVHFIFVYSDSMGIVLRGLKQVIQKENPHTVSWFKPDMSLRFIRLKERDLCHQ